MRFLADGELAITCMEADLAVSEVVEIGAGDAKPYTGIYALKSSFADQRLDTKDRIMRADVTVAAMEYAEVGNTSGGLTLTIGG